METLINEFLHCIIHKPVACHPALPGKDRAGNPDAEMGAKAFSIGSAMACMRRAFVQHFKLARLQSQHQLLFNCGNADGGCGVDGGFCHGVPSGFMCLFK